MNDDANIGCSEGNRKFKEAVYLAPFLEHLELIRQVTESDEPIVVYRTQHNIPVDEYGQTPNILRARKGIGRKISHVFTREEVEQLSPEDKTRAVGKYGLSCNPTRDAAEESFVKGYMALLKRDASAKEKEEYIQKRGEYICKFIITKEAALVTEFRNNHANIYLYEGVELEDCRDKTFEPYKIDYQSYED